MDRISLAVITRNSEKTLDAALESARGLVSEIVLVDDHSTDGTLNIAQAHGARVFTQKLVSCAAQKQFALDQAYDDHLASHLWRIPYPSLDAVQTVLGGLAESDPRARDAQPAQLVNDRFLREPDEGV